MSTTIENKLKFQQQNELYDLLAHIFPSNRLTLKESNSKLVDVLWDECDYINLKNYAN
jgi:hypothetical protein